MNTPQAPLWWRIAATLGPERVALGIIVVLAVIVAVALASGGTPGYGPQVNGPSPSPETSALVITGRSPWW